MKSLDEAIARCQSQLRFIPIAELRQARVLMLLNELTNTHLSCGHLLDALGNYLSVTSWPLPGPWMLAKIHEIGPALIALMLNSDILLDAWDREPGVAFILPENIFRPSLLNHFICKQLNQNHLAIIGYPERSDGSRVALFITRDQSGPPYSDGDLRTIDRVCAVFADELSTLTPARLLMPRHATPREHTFALGPDFHPVAPSHYARAVLALFYDQRGEVSDGPPRLPVGLEADLRTHRDQNQRLGDIDDEDFAYAFSKNHLGRVLLLNLRATSGGGYQLTVHEDLAQHTRLYRIKAACRQLTRDRTNVYVACLLVAEGVRDPAEIARRGGFGALKDSSALRLVNQARRIVAEA
jgi:hypothetical protein